MLNSEPRIISTIKNFFNYNFDRALSGGGLKKILVLFSFYIVVYLTALIIASTVFPNEIMNREMKENSWAILYHMIDPGSLHLVGSTPDIEIASQSDTTKPQINVYLRFFVFSLTILGSTILWGLLISTFTSIFENRVNLIREGLTGYHYKKHCVILGYTNLSESLVFQLVHLYPNQKLTIVILTTSDVFEIKNRLFSRLPTRQLKYINVLHGDRTSPKDLLRVSITGASEIFLIGEDNEPDSDSKNIACINLIESIYKDFSIKQRDNWKYSKNKKDIPEKKRALCTVLFNSQTTHAACQYFDIRKEFVEIHSFSYYDEWARKIFVSCDPPNTSGLPIHSPTMDTSETSVSASVKKHRVFCYQPLDFEPITPQSEKYVNLIVAGMSTMGLAIAVQGARLAHFTNSDRCKTRITLIDSAIDCKRNFFANRFQSFYESVDSRYTDTSSGKTIFRKGELPYINTELHFVDGAFESKAIRDVLLQLTEDPNALTTLAICFNDPDCCLAAGLYLPDEIFCRNVNTLIHQSSENSILALTPKDSNVFDKFNRVKIFGMQNEGLDLRLNNKFKAMAVNYFYASPSLSLSDTFSLQQLSEMKILWNSLKERFKWSNRNNAESISTKIRTLQNLQHSTSVSKNSFTYSNTELLARMEHSRWNADALLSGFYPAPPEVRQETSRTADLIWLALQKAGGNFSDKDVIRLKNEHEAYVNEWKRKMIHPCIVPYDDLSEYYREIDRRLVRSIDIIEKENDRLNSIDWKWI